MRLIVLDTETTGLSPFKGDRMVEIGAVEICRRAIQPEHTFHHYLNPGRPIPEEVVRIHGISDADVRDAPRFADVASDFLDFIRDATLVIHNAAFDLGFIMHELHLAGQPSIDQVPVIDTLQLARQRHPQRRNNLDALCDRYRIDRSHRERHGALLDSELLAEVYLAMTGGRQFSLDTDVQAQPAASFIRLPENLGRRDEKAETSALMSRQPPPVPEEDLRAHQAMLKRVHEASGQAIWLLPPGNG